MALIQVYDRAEDGRPLLLPDEEVRFSQPDVELVQDNESIGVGTLFVTTEYA